MTQPCPSYRIVRAVAASGLVALLAACAATSNIGTDVLTTGMANPEIALRESMRLVDAEMTKLGTLNTSAAPRITETIVPGELQKTVTFAFVGSLDDGVRKLADTVGYTVTITPPPPGTAPLPPLTVNVTTGFVTAVAAFSALGEAAGSRALVRVDPQRHLVEVIHYA